jgi:hypothetical protein
MENLIRSTNSPFLKHKLKRMKLRTLQQKTTNLPGVLFLVLVVMVLILITKLIII